MSFMDLHTLKVEPQNDDFFNEADTQHPDYGSQFEMYDVPDPTVHVPDAYPGSFHVYTPYMNTGNSIGIPTPQRFDDSENLSKTSHTRHHKVSRAPLKYRTNTGSTAPAKPYNSCRGRATYNGRRSTSERRDRINERERDRMHMLCDAFEQLRQVLPLKKPKRGPHRQKLSKISTLVFAQNYIRTLEDILENPAEYADCRLSPSDDKGGAACASRGASATYSSAPSPGRSVEAEYAMVFNQSEYYPQYNNDTFVGGPSYGY